MMPWQARAQVLVRGCNAKTPAIIDNKWKPFHVAMKSARQARAGSSSRLYCEDADYYWQYNAFQCIS